MVGTTALNLGPAYAQPMPTDAQTLCGISPPAFAAMFESGAVTLNGAVRPADSTITLTPNCPFFEWSAQMFLWLTSPAPRRYGGSGRIMFSPAFYTVSPPGADGRRTFLRNERDRPIRMMLRATELGPHLLPALLARTGQVIEVARPDPRNPVQPVVRLQNGARIRLGDVRRTRAGGLQFFDTRGRQVQVRRPALPRVRRTIVRMPDGRRMSVVPVASVREAIQVRQFVLRDIPIFLDARSNVIDVEPGQAGGGVLISQNGSLVYYITVVNQLFAFHRTMQGPALILPGTTLTFPLTMADANAVVAFAAANGTTIIDPEALAIEAKSSWVEASSVPHPDDYIQVEATIPTFDTSNPNMWVPNGQKTVTLAMVGIGIAGSTEGQGEMVWGSYEPFGNAPNAAYDYLGPTGAQTMPQNTAGTWLFTPGGWPGPFNAMHASWNSATGNIVGTPAGPSPVLRRRPWGSDPSDAVTNTQVISLNASVIGQLKPGDVRRNYFQVGTTWTIGGQAPDNSNQVGTNQLANSAIETFVQAAGPTGTGSNCFSCHGTNTVEVSHVYRQMHPLF